MAAFEEEFAAFQGAQHGIGTNSGTSALHLALLAAGVGAGDEVITTPFTFVATAAAILYTGARPVYVDIEPETYNLNPGRYRRSDHAADQGDRAGPLVRPSRGYGPDHGPRARAQVGGD